MANIVTTRFETAFLWELPKKRGEAFLLTVGAFLLTVELLCLQSHKALN